MMIVQQILWLNPSILEGKEKNIFAKMEVMTKVVLRLLSSERHTSQLLLMENQLRSYSV